VNDLGMDAVTTCNSVDTTNQLHNKPVETQQTDSQITIDSAVTVTLITGQESGSIAAASDVSVQLLVTSYCSYSLLLCACPEPATNTTWHI